MSLWLRKDYAPSLNTSLIKWPAAPLNPSFEHKVVHLWAWNVDCYEKDISRYSAVLSPDERSHLQLLRFHNHRVRYAVNHMIRRLILSRYLTLEPRDISFVSGTYGKPSLAPTLDASRLHFNTSHTRNIGLLAVAFDLEVGVDIEVLVPIETSVAEYYLSSSECARLAHLTGRQWREEFYKCWTRKEALLKAIGTGLYPWPNMLDAGIQLRTKGKATTFRQYPDAVDRWEVISLRPSKMLIGSLVTSSVPRRVETCRLVEI